MPQMVSLSTYMRFFRAALWAALSACFCDATAVARLSLEDMVRSSELIIIGRVTRVWSAWDGQHRFIWTHNEIAVHDAAKGGRGESLVVSEPGGVVNGEGMRIAGAPTYAPGEQVLLFLERVPNGYLRSMGLGQGKLRISADGRVHLTHSGADFVKAGQTGAGTAMESLEGAAAAQIRERLARLLQPGGKLQ